MTGPPGAGKTSLLTAWLNERPPPERVGWLSVEPSHARPARFWGEMRKLLREATGCTLSDVPDPSEAADPDFVAALGNAAGELTRPVLVVLDDFEQLHSRAVTDSLDLFLRIPQQGVRLVILSRLDPALSLQRLRLEGRLTDLRSTDLTLCLGDAARLFTMAGVKLTAEQIATLHERTEGWTGGLSLAALSLRAHPDPDAFVRSFAGDDRAVADYLIEEVLHQQSPAMRDFMLRTSVVEGLEPDLADALTGRHDGARSLALLERSNAFLIPLDEHRCRYRYHPMFQELLRSQLRYRMPEAYALQHRRAARWFATTGAAAVAVHHAVAAGDVDMAADLLGEHWLSLIARGHTAELADWIAALPRIVNGDAGLAAAAAGAALAAEDLARAQSLITLSDTRAGAVPPKRRAHFALSRATVGMLEARVRGDADATRTAAHKVLAAHQIAGAPDDFRVIAYLNLGIAERWTNAPDAGLAHLETALALARRDSCTYLVVDCLGQLAQFKALDGALYEATELGRTAVRLAAGHGWDADPVTGTAHLGLAIAHFNRAEFDQADEHITSAARRSRARLTRCLTELLRARLLARSDLSEAVRVANAARAEIEASDLPRGLVAAAGLLEAATLADAGEPDRAHAALARGSVAIEAPFECAVVRARLALAAGDPADASRQLNSENSRGSCGPHPGARIEQMALDAVARHLLHDDQGALDVLEQALRRAQPEGHRLPLLAAGPTLRDLLKRRIRAGTAHRALAGELIEQLDGDRLRGGERPQRSLLDPLSDREEAVLRYLATAMSKAEIASELFVSVNTVKTHTKNIYRKLGVGTRTEAVRRSKQLNLV